MQYRYMAAAIFRPYRLVGGIRIYRYTCDNFQLCIICEGYSVNDKGDIEFDEFLHDPTTASNVRRPRAVGAANKKVRDQALLLIVKISKCWKPFPCSYFYIAL